MNRTESIEYAEKLRGNKFETTKDKKYNEGLKDVIRGSYETNAARYYFMCNGN